MIRWILLAAEAVLAGIGLYCFFAHRKDYQEAFILKAVVESVGAEAAKRLPSLRILPQDIRRRIRILHPDRTEKESCTEYIHRQAVQIYAILLIANTLLLVAVLSAAEAADVGYSLERPVYGRSDRTAALIAEGSEEKAEVRITVPSQDPTAEQADAVLRSAEEWLREEAAVPVEAGEDFQLPVRIGNVDVSYLKNAEDGIVQVGEDGYTRFAETEVQTEELQLTAALFYRGYRRICTLLIPVKQEAAPTFASTVQAAVQSAELTPSELILPSSVFVDGKEENVVWQTRETGREIGRYAVLAWILPFALLPLSRLDLRRKEKERARQITLKFPFLIEKLTVYLGAGLSLTEAWNRIASGAKEDPLTEEMEVTRVRIRNGMALQEALKEFGGRIPNADIRKLSGMLVRNMRRGDEFLLDRLAELNQDAWESYRKEVRIRSEETETRMLLPMTVLLIVVLLLVMAPAMLTFRG